MYFDDFRNSTLGGVKEGGGGRKLLNFSDFRNPPLPKEGIECFKIYVHILTAVLDRSVKFIVRNLL